MARCANEFEEDVTLDLPLLKGTAFHMRLKRAMSKLHGERPKFARERGTGVPVWSPRGPVERAFFRFREALWKPRVERAIREHALDSYDLYHLESGVEFYRDARFLHRMKARGAHVVCSYLGTDLRDRGVIPAVRAVSDLNLTCEWDHLRLDPTLEYFFIPFEVDSVEFREPATARLRIAHAPRNRAIKGTEIVLAAVERARAKGAAIELDLIEGVTHAEAMWRKRAANLVIDQVGDHGATGYGMNSLEGFAMGIPCMTSMEPEYERFLGDHPFIVTRPETLEAELTELARDPTLLSARARRGREWVERVHGADNVVRRLYARYREFGWMP